MEKTASLKVFHVTESIKEIYAQPQSCSVVSREHLEGNIHLLDTPEKRHRMEPILKALKFNPNAKEFAILEGRVLAI